MSDMDGCFPTIYRHDNDILSLSQNIIRFMGYFALAKHFINWDGGSNFFGRISDYIMLYI